MERINLAEKFSLFSEQWSPKIIGELNGQYVKLAKVEGKFVWHSHATEDELFMVVKGALTIKFRDHDVHLQEGDICIVPRGVEHKPVAEQEAHLILIEAKSTAHTGNVESDKTVSVEEQVWI